MKTAKSIQNDIFQMVKGSDLARAINGSVYLAFTEDGKIKSYRPRDSKKEDIIVVFTAGTSGDIAEGVITVNIFTPQITPFSDGVYVENGMRCAELEQAAAEFFLSANGRSPYLFSLNSSIVTENDSALRQSFVVLRLNYRVVND